MYRDTHVDRAPLDVIKKRLEHVQRIQRIDTSLKAELKYIFVLGARK